VSLVACQTFGIEQIQKGKYKPKDGTDSDQSNNLAQQLQMMQAGVAANKAQAIYHAQAQAQLQAQQHVIQQQCAQHQAQQYAQHQAQVGPPNLTENLLTLLISL
jgi:hypothetical protein